MRLIPLITLLATTLAFAQPPASYDIAYFGTCAGTFGICIIHSDASQPRLLRPASTTLLFPGWWSPDGSKLVTYSQGVVVQLDLNGGPDEKLPVQMLSLDVQMVWSPDSTRLAFASGFEDPHINDPEVQRGRQLYSTAIYVVDVPTKKVTRISPLGQYRWISWAPDGRRLVFSGAATGERKSDILVVDAAGAAAPRPIFSGPAFNVQPSWSPKGDQIAFLATSMDPANGGLYVMRPDGTMPRRVSPVFGAIVAWSPDARFLLTGTSIVNVSTGAIVDVGKDLGKQPMLDGAFAPDGRSVLYRTSNEGKGTINAIDVDGTHRRKLADGDFFAVSPLRKP